MAQVTSRLGNRESAPVEERIGIDRTSNREMPKELNYVYHIRSDVATSHINGASSILVDFDEKFVFPTDAHVFVKLLSATIPHSFYNISSTTNKVQVTESDLDGSNEQSAYTVTIPESNYNITQLIAVLQEQLNSNSNHGVTYAVSYSTQSNKVTISTDTVNKKAVLDFTITGACKLPLGFGNGAYTVDTSTDLESPNGVQVFIHNNLYIRTNLQHTNTFDKNGKRSNILRQTPILTLPNQIIHIDGRQDPEISISNQHLGSLAIHLTYDNEQDFVDLNGLDWELVLLLTVRKLT